ncbi:MAG: Stk1 family PASTA domain-containing Ser/Thr kinase [Demequinaceae bacterium]|nr:Stk1 family PASTA domain-containing Ser/Thr kinase [Demequinaceae bacterium]
MSDTLTDPYIGHIVDGRYLVRERLAFGGMATVYRATDRRLGRDVALKIMNPAFFADSEGSDFGARFRREARAAARLTHPGMVRVYDQGVDGDTSYLTMEYIKGPNLRQYLASVATIPVGEAFSIVERVLDAVGAAHRQGLVHRDIKPENILIDPDGLPKLADFGIARAATEVTATTTGKVLGTVAYLAPELVRNGESDSRTDVYAIGVLLFELVTGRQPFTGSSAIEIAARHVHEDVPAPSSYVPWLPPEFDALIAKLTERDPNLRPFDANEALPLLRETRSMIDDPTLARRAEPPSGTVPVTMDTDSTVSLEPTPTGATVALPIGLGEAGAREPDDDRALIPVPPPPKKPTSASWIIAIAAAAAVLTAVAFWWYTTAGPGAYAKVPQVSGMTIEEATTVLTDLGLDAQFIQAFDDEVPIGRVVSTTPEEGGSVSKEGTVTVTVSLGPRMTEIPLIVGIDEGDARSQLTVLGFPEPDVTREYSDTVSTGDVISVDPEEGQTVRHDTLLTLVISNGPKPITFPDVLGSAEDTARTVLEDQYGLEVLVESGRTSEYAKGLVYDQDPSGGETGHRTDTITIWVSEGPPLVTVPGYYFMEKEDAQEAAEELGLVVTLQKQHWWSTGNRILDQNIAPGSKVEVGTTIILTYG